MIHQCHALQQPDSLQRWTQDGSVSGESSRKGQELGEDRFSILIRVWSQDVQGCQHSWDCTLEHILW